MKKAMIIMNPSSGKEEALEYVSKAEDVLQNQGYEVTVKETAKQLDATKYCLHACKDCYDLVVSIGGDGTLHETINGLMDQQHRPKLGVIPLGTVNDFARALNIPLDPVKAIDSLTSTAVKSVDIGKINNRLFANVVAAGSLAESLSSVSPTEKTKLGAFAYVKEGIKELISTSSHPLTIIHDGVTWAGESYLFLAALTNSVGGFEKLIPGAAIDDGLLHCFIVKDIHVLNTITVGTSLLLGNLKDHKDIVYFTAKHVRLASNEEVHTNLDGENGPPLPLELSVMPSYIQVIVPES